jgi:molybdenum cofactor cytidylyltransferase
MCGPNKLLAPWGPSTVVGTVVRTLLSAGLDVVVVTGRDAEAVARAVAPARSVFNPRFEEGLGTSIAAGVAACGESDGYLIALGDMPGLSGAVVRRILDELEGLDEGAIVAPFYADELERFGHPVLFGSAHRDALIALTGDVGARGVIELNLGRLFRVPADGELRGIDSPADVPAN